MTLFSALLEALRMAFELDDALEGYSRGRVGRGCVERMGSAGRLAILVPDRSPHDSGDLGRIVGSVDCHGLFYLFCKGRCSMYIPALTLVELGEACHRGAVAVSSGVSFEEWARAAFASGKYHEAQLTAEIVYVAQRLYSIAERGDRLIAATAAALDLPLITRDPDIAAAAGVESVWS